MIKKVLLLMAVLVLLTSCNIKNSKNIPSQESINTMQSSSNTSSLTASSIPLYIDYYSYSETNPNDDFHKTMYGNPIDAAFNKEPYPDTTMGWGEFLSKYSDAWAKELEFSIKNFTALLDEKDKKEFKLQQSNWENWKTGMLAFDSSILTEKYGINMGKQTPLAFEKAEISLYKERDFHIKYLTYMLETNVDNPKPSNELKWDKFLF